MAIELTNRTPFANLRFSNLDARGREFGVLMVKQAFDIPKDGGACQLSDEQEPFVLTDEYHGELNTSALRYPSDFVPFKPVTDVVLDATAFATNGQARNWIVGVSVADSEGRSVERRLRVTGPRSWRSTWHAEPGEKADDQARERLFAGWAIDDPEPIDRLPIRYEYAFGGPVVVGIDDDGAPIIDDDERNPIGRGRLPSGVPKPGVRVPAAQLLPVSAAPDDHEPGLVGFGPIPPAWLPRRPLGGTYDQRWMDEVWPRWAEDYDFRFHNSAPEAMQADGFLRGNLDVRLEGLHPSLPSWSFELPVAPIVASVLHEDGRSEQHAMQVDTVFLDVADPTADPRAFLVLRTAFDMFSAILIDVERADSDGAARTFVPEDVARIPPADDDGASEERQANATENA